MPPGPCAPPNALRQNLLHRLCMPGFSAPPCSRSRHLRPRRLTGSRWARADAAAPRRPPPLLALPAAFPGRSRRLGIPHLREARTLALQGLPRGAASGRLERRLVHGPQAAQRLGLIPLIGCVCASDAIVASAGRQILVSMLWVVSKRQRCGAAGGCRARVPSMGGCSLVACTRLQSARQALHRTPCSHLLASTAGMRACAGGGRPRHARGWRRSAQPAPRAARRSFSSRPRQSGPSRAWTSACPAPQRGPGPGS